MQICRNKWLTILQTWWGGNCEYSDQKSMKLHISIMSAIRIITETLVYKVLFPFLDFLQGSFFFKVKFIIKHLKEMIK